MHETIPASLSSLALRRLSTPATYWAEAEYVGRRSGGNAHGGQKRREEKKEEVFFSSPVFGRLKRGGGGGEGEPHSQGRDGQTDGAVPTEKKGEWDSPNFVTFVMAQKVKTGSEEVASIVPT